MTEHAKTETTEINHRHYCSYCWEPAKKATDWDEYDEVSWWYCTCEMAENELKYSEIIRTLNAKIAEVQGEWEGIKKSFQGTQKYWENKYQADCTELRLKFELKLRVLIEEQEELKRSQQNWKEVEKNES